MIVATMPTTMPAQGIHLAGRRNNARTPVRVKIPMANQNRYSFEQDGAGSRDVVVALPLAAAGDVERVHERVPATCEGDRYEQQCGCDPGILLELTLDLLVGTRSLRHSSSGLRMSTWIGTVLSL